MSIIAALVLVTILAVSIMLLMRRRRRNDTKRWTFHQDMMVQGCQQPAPISPSSLHSTCVNLHPEDLKQGIHTLAPPVYTELPILDPKPRIPDPVVYPSRMMI